MNLKFNGDQDLIRSIEEGSRLLLSEKKTGWNSCNDLFPGKGP